jgi:hypothetical protein
MTAGKQGANLLLGEFRRNSSEVVRVVLARFKGRMFVDLRCYFEDDEGTFRPTKKGVAISPDLWDEFRTAIEATERELVTRGLWAPERSEGDRETSP